MSIYIIAEATSSVTLCCTHVTLFPPYEEDADSRQPISSLAEAKDSRGMGVRLSAIYNTMNTYSGRCMRQRGRHVKDLNTHRRLREYRFCNRGIVDETIEK